ncbi:oxidoreductase, zinc-binding dehydrogenase family [Acidobacterium capsulatum ATCC 51196]|uniref:Oxidoreductase, zinc-binding dehydrogenase family n=1 Tax=Acidobacterium capsulatum (strain ATCC 51196 / DSM 11244 / BCRC 80197 / JCM 7670 / NBRC 15755 / NCIMB 13165 / 161) TaxID=240015 RepID=C1F5E7_ACIC5|nr:oxidoreductase, zinc-binding dehydrogenase family [Acidobacterium capsulatum ATCC 51196]
MKAVQITALGGREVLNVRDVAMPTLRTGQVLIRVCFSGVNFIDVYYREGKYKTDLPFVPGAEGSGYIAGVGEGVVGFSEGDPVAWYGPLGSCAEYAAVDASMVIKISAGIPLSVAAALMMQGITAHYLAHSTFPLQEGHTALVHAAAGGVGHLLTQMAKRAGARVLATVSSEEKASIAKDAGASEVILYHDVDFDAAARNLTDGVGVDVVYDGVGKTTFEGSLRSLRPLGMLALYGASSGPVPPFDLSRLSAMGSLFITRPMSFDYIRPHSKYVERTDAIFAMYQNRVLNVHVDTVFPLEEAAAAYELLESRRSKGKILLSLA